MALRAFFSVLAGRLSEDIATAFGYVKAPSRRPPEPAKEPVAKASDGALQLLGILQRDARLIDFLMEDITPYSDEQIGSAVRNIHAQSREALKKCLTLAPVIDGVEGTFTQPEAAGAVAREANAIKFIGNLPAQGKPRGGLLRHRGWRVDSINLPAPPARQNLAILAPAELEVE